VPFAEHNELLLGHVQVLDEGLVQGHWVPLCALPAKAVSSCQQRQADAGRLGWRCTKCRPEARLLLCKLRGHGAWGTISPMVWGTIIRQFVQTERAKTLTCTVDNLPQGLAMPAWQETIESLKQYLDFGSAPTLPRSSGLHWNALSARAALLNRRCDIQAHRHHRTLLC